MTGDNIRNPAELHAAFQKSKFRSSFKLNQKDYDYIDRIGLGKIRSHAYDFLKNRLGPARPKNDGKQTPFKGHPVFKAQHATATCCRKCLEKWYGIPKGRELKEIEINRLVGQVVYWIQRSIS